MDRGACQAKVRHDWVTSTFTFSLSSKGHFELQVSVANDFANYSLHQRKATSTQGISFKIWTYCLCDTATTLFEKKLLAGYWAFIKAELLMHGCPAMTPLRDVSTWVYINSNSVTNKVRRLQLGLHGKWYIKNTAGVIAIFMLEEKVTAIPLWETLSSILPCEENHWLQRALKSQRHLKAWEQFTDCSAVPKPDVVHWAAVTTQL